MENASKALLMAAGMLLVVMIASMFALMFSTMSEYTKAYDERKQTEELQAFNGQFEKYVTSGATAQDVVTVINLAKSYNEKMEEETIKVTVIGTGFNYTQDTLDSNSFLYDKSQGTDTDGKIKMIKYTIDNEISWKDSSGKINEIKFKQNGFFD